MKSQTLVRDYFNREAERFDAIYEVRKPLLQRVVDRLFRGVVIERFRLICALAPSTNGRWTVLDVGCGSGRYALALARAGAARVVGVDGAAAMIDLAKSEAAGAGVGDRCEFVTIPFLDWTSDERFDVVVATGYFDYLENPLEHLQRMMRACRGRIFMTIPKRWEARVPTRKLRFALARGFVRFYSRADLDALLRQAGIQPERSATIDLGRDWVVVIRCDQPQP